MAAGVLAAVRNAEGLSAVRKPMVQRMQENQWPSRHKELPENKGLARVHDKKCCGRSTCCRVCRRTKGCWRTKGCYGCKRNSGVLRPVWAEGKSRVAGEPRAAEGDGETRAARESMATGKSGSSSVS